MAGTRSLRHLYDTTPATSPHSTQKTAGDSLMPHNVSTRHGTQEMQTHPGSVDWNALPGLCRHLRELVGERTARQILQTMGGRDLYIPRTPSPGHPLAALHPEDARRICQAFHGERLSIPQARWLQRQDRDKAIRTARGNGQSVSQLARTFGLSRRRIQQILASPAHSTPGGQA